MAGPAVRIALLLLPCGDTEALVCPALPCRGPSTSRCLRCIPRRLACRSAAVKETVDITYCLPGWPVSASRAPDFVSLGPTCRQAYSYLGSSTERQGRLRGLRQPPTVMGTLPRQKSYRSGGTGRSAFVLLVVAFYTYVMKEVQPDTLVSR